MKKSELNKAIEAKRHEYYEWIAKLVLENPGITLTTLREAHGITYWAMQRAQKIFKITRRRGSGSLAAKK
jgi:hypothetical protein